MPTTTPFALTTHGMFVSNKYTFACVEDLMGLKSQTMPSMSL